MIVFTQYLVSISVEHLLDDLMEGLPVHHELSDNVDQFLKLLFALIWLTEKVDVDFVKIRLLSAFCIFLGFGNFLDLEK